MNKTVALFVSFACLAIGLCAGGSSVLSAEESRKIFEFNVVETEEITGRFTTVPGEKITVDWGDGTQETFSGSMQRYVKNYGKPLNARVSVHAGDESVLTEFRMDKDGADIEFNLEALPEGLAAFSAAGHNTVSGDIKDLPRGLTTLAVTGRNTITGDIKDLPPGVKTLNIQGRNTLSGDIKNIPFSATYFLCYGQNTITGDIKDLPRWMTTFLCLGSNTISGDIKDLPRRMTYFYCTGANTVTGDLKDAPEEMTIFRVAGSGTALSGDIADLPGKLTWLEAGHWRGISRCKYNYTGGRSWAEDMSLVRVRGGERGLTTAEVDNLLIDLSKTTWARPKQIDLSVNNAPRSSASDEAVAALENMGVTVKTK